MSSVKNNKSGITFSFLSGKNRNKKTKEKKDKYLEDILGLKGTNTGRIENLEIDDIVIKRLAYRGVDKMNYYECECRCGSRLFLNTKELAIPYLRLCGTNKSMILDDTL